MSSQEALVQTLRALEVALHDPETRADRARIEGLLHPDFFEIGYSGRCYSREEICAALACETMPAIHAQDFAATWLAHRVALLTYRSLQMQGARPATRHALRASIWCRQDGVWRLRFHQATPCAAFAQPDD